MGSVCLLAASCLLVLAAPAWAQGFKELEAKVAEKTLPNGLKVIILPRHEAPVVSFVTYADVGSVNEQVNATGLAHIFEHMAFKGTTTIGTLDIAKEKAAMAKVDEAFAALRAERLKMKPDEARIKALEETFKKAQEEAQKYVDTHAYDKILERNGAQGLNAFTSFDQTVYLYSLPSNKVELWAATESDRFTNPVLREFYKEKDVIMEERRMGESRPTGRLFEDFFAAAYKVHMYRSYVIGAMSDLQAITRQQAMDWFRTHYSAKNLTAVLVGDVDPATTLPLLEKYLGRIPAGNKPEPPVTVEPPQREEKRLILEDPSQPFLLIGYHRPNINDPDNAVYEVLAGVLGEGRSSRLYKALVKEKKSALMVRAMASIEGEKYPGIFAVLAVPNKGKTNAECEEAIYAEMARLQSEPVTAEELDGVKARAKMRFIDGIDSNMGIAIQLAMAQNLQGDWREMFNQLDKIDKVTAQDVQRVAKTLFVKSNRTVGLIETTPAKSGK
jgi:predicted Zn-dependent peptidase